MSNKIKITFLGTSASVPTANKNLTSVLLNYQGDNYLFDCPENVQQQIMKSKQSLMKIKHIFITHFHGDHFFGILGLLATMNLNNREEDLTIYLPEKNKQSFLDLLSSAKIVVSFKINVIGIKKEQAIIKNKNLTITSVKLDHTIPTYGFSFKIKDTLGKFNREKALKLKIPEGPLFSKLSEGKSIKLNGKTITPDMVLDKSKRKIGKKILYLTDTKIIKPKKSLENSDILIHECTFGKDEEKKANLVKHSTSVGVANFAKKIKTNSLYLVHISSRYQETDQISTDAKKIFKNTIIPKDLDSFEIEDY